MLTVRKKFDTLQEISERHTTNDEHENFIITHIDTTTKYIPTKPKAKCKISWKSIVKEQQEYIQGQINKIRNSVENVQSQLHDRQYMK